MDFRRQMNDFFAQIYRQNELYDIWAKQNRMKPSTVAVLYLLDQFETCTQGWISKIYLLPKQTIHTVVQELEQVPIVDYCNVMTAVTDSNSTDENGNPVSSDTVTGQIVVYLLDPLSVESGDGSEEYGVAADSDGNMTGAVDGAAADDGNETGAVDGTVVDGGNETGVVDGTVVDGGNEAEAVDGAATGDGNETEANDGFEAGTEGGAQE